MFLFCSCLPCPPLTPAPHIPLTPADDYMPAALHAGRALLFSLQMRSDICTGLSQRGSRARGDTGPLTERGRAADGRGASEAALINTILNSPAATADRVEERLSG